MNEYFDNLTAECLDETNGTKYPEFVALNNLGNSFCKYFENMNLRSQLKAQVQAQQLREQLNQYMKEKSAQIQEQNDVSQYNTVVNDVNEYKTPPPTSIPSNEKIKDEKIKIDENFLKFSLAIASEELKAVRDADKKQKQQIITDITDPTPGAVVKDFFEDNDNQFQTTTNKPVDLNKFDKKNTFNNC